MTTRTIALLALALLAAPAVAGTWGAGSFQSDHALDTASDWAEAGSPRAIAMTTWPRGLPGRPRRMKRADALRRAERSQRLSDRGRRPCVE
jgi:hypothetical protein